jgi:hypothetical protein
VRRLGLGIVVALVLGASVAVAPSGVAADDMCARFSPGVVSGTVKTDRLTEISGVVASRTHPGVYWTHNDSGGKPEVFALTADGADLGSYAFPGATATDWEDIAVGPKAGATGSYIYAADIGDNASEAPAGVLGAARDHITVWRAPEPAAAPKAPGVALSGVERIDLNYPDSTYDAEALLVDPRSGDLVIVTKSPLGMSHLMVAPAAALVNGSTVTLRDDGIIQIIPPVKVSTFPGTWVTGVDISSDGSLILLRTYQAVLAFTRASGQSVTDALHGQSSNAPQTDETQGEANAIASDTSRYITISEGVHEPIHSFAIANASAPATTAPSPPAPVVGGEVLARPGASAARALEFAFVVLGLALVTRWRARSRVG